MHNRHGIGRAAGAAQELIEIHRRVHLRLQHLGDAEAFRENPDARNHGRRVLILIIELQAPQLRRCVRRFQIACERHPVLQIPRRGIGDADFRAQGRRGGPVAPGLLRFVRVAGSGGELEPRAGGGVALGADLAQRLFCFASNAFDVKVPLVASAKSSRHSQPGWLVAA